LLTVSDLEMKTFFSVKRQLLPAFDASKEQLAEACRERRGFMQTAKLRYDAIKHPERKSITRDDILDENEMSLGRHIRQGTARFEAEKLEHSRQLRRLDTAAEEAGISLPENVRNPERVRQGIALWNESNAEIALEKDGAAPPKTVKNYFLHGAAPTAKPTNGLYWALWAKVEKAKPGLNRHGLTRKTLGAAGSINPNVKDMTEAQLAKMIEVFSAILRDAAVPAL
jgi:hypothetical protein